jgi:hypothetical protein
MIKNRISVIRDNQEKVEEILVRELEKRSAQPTSENNDIAGVALALIELWKIMDPV